MSKSTTHEIVIIGGHYAGLGTAHYLLKHIIPQLSTATQKNYHITIIYPHREFFWNIAAPRHVVSATVIAPEKIWMSSDRALKSYTKDSPTTIIGTATAVNPDTKVVSVQVADGVQEIAYSTLIIATGTTSNSKLWQVNEHQDVSKALYSDLHATLPKAKTILIAGGGAVGVETAGEIATHYHNASITVLSGSASLLPRLSPKPGKKAEAKLKKMGVAVGHGSKVVSNTKNQDGTTTVVLSDGTQKKVDVFIDATGGKPNTSFLPSAWLDPKGYVKVDDKTLRGPAKDIYAIGDVASYSNGSYIDVNNGVPIVGSSIGIDLATEAGKKDLIAQKVFNPFPAQFVPIGPGAGVGEVFGWSIPSFLVWLVKSRTFFVDKAESGWDGSGFAKA